ncbi:S41 family peptidase [Empedobacter sp. UBA7248]|uniref:S41 family peptidase n=1 Tax=Empedobacter sp. UBA7248 TaxID=1946448 RepID=UPI0025C637CB|nr:S41 family peptidase [Empedobacter sp. UBA7248]
MRINRFSFIFLILFTFGCKEKVVNESSVSEITSDYEELFSVMKKGFIDRDKVDWENLEKKVIEKSKISKDSAIVEAITLLGNNHTHYLTKDNVLLRGRFPKAKVDSACLLKVDDNSKLIKIPNVAYIRIKRHGFDKTISDKDYIFNNLKIISEQANSNYWIIDLRDNLGGSNWAMITSLLPFYEDNILGYSKINNDDITWSKKDGYFFNGVNNLSKGYLNTPIVNTIHPKKIYVLINQKTSSAGEATLISLKSLSNVKVLGNKTMGAATINAETKLFNGDMLVLTAGYMMDAKKNIYPKGISPDYELCTEDDILNFIKSDIKK